MPEIKKEHALPALMGVGLLKGVLGDYPKGLIDEATRRTVASGMGRRFPAGRELLRKAFTGVALGRAAGGVVAGGLTFPLFYSGMKDLKSEDPGRKVSGIAKVLGSGVVYSAGKGGIDYLWRGLRDKSSFPGLALKDQVRRGMVSRGLTGLGAAAITAYGLAHALKKKEKGEGKSVLPAAAGLGAAIGAGKGLFDTGILQRTGPWWKPGGYLATLKKPRMWIPETAGRAVGTAFGTAVLGGLLDKLLKKESQEALPGGMRPEFSPYPHQTRAVDKFLANGQLVMAHATGSGKTATTVYAIEEARRRGLAQRALVVVPAGLKNNFAKDGVEKFTTSDYQIVGSQAETGAPKTVSIMGVQAGPTYTVVSYEMFLKDPVGLLTRSGSDTLILDEVHRVRNEQAKIFRAATVARQYAKNFIGLTASPINNSPAEIAALVNLATGGQYIPTRTFKRRYLRKITDRRGFFGGKKEVRQLIRQPEIAEYVEPAVDYQSAEGIRHLFPKKEVTLVDVPMSDTQKQYYEYVMRQLGPIQRMIVGRQVDIPDNQIAHIFGQIVNARRVLNDVSAANPAITKEQSSFETPKLNRVLTDLQEHLRTVPDAQAVIYSNLIQGGLDATAAGLRARNIPFGIFIGAGREIGGITATHQVRNKAVDEYKAGRLKVLLLSGAGAEGLDLKNTTAFFSLDGHWNPERIVQAESRAVRLKGQESRPPEQRKVDVYRYRTVYPSTWYSKRKPTVDEWIYDVAARKHQVNEQLRDVLKTKLPPGARVHKYLQRYRSPTTGEWVYKYPPREEEMWGIRQTLGLRGTGGHSDHALRAPRYHHGLAKQAEGPLTSLFAPQPNTSTGPLEPPKKLSVDPRLLVRPPMAAKPKRPTFQVPSVACPSPPSPFDGRNRYQQRLDTLGKV